MNTIGNLFLLLLIIQVIPTQNVEAVGSSSSSSDENEPPIRDEEPPVRRPRIAAPIIPIVAIRPEERPHNGHRPADSSDSEEDIRQHPRYVPLVNLPDEVNPRARALLRRRDGILPGEGDPGIPQGLAPAIPNPNDGIEVVEDPGPSRPLLDALDLQGPSGSRRPLNLPANASRPSTSGARNRDPDEDNSTLSVTPTPSNSTSEASSLSPPETSDEKSPEAKDDTDADSDQEQDVEVLIANYTQRMKRSNMNENTSKYKPFHSRNKERHSSDTCERSEDVLSELEEYKLNIDQPIWHHYTFDTGSYNREELEIVEVVAEKSFSIDKQIIEWTSLDHQAVGRGNHGLTLITSRTDGIQIDTKEYDESVSLVSMFHWWNKETNTRSTGLLTAHRSMLRWHHFKDDNTLEELWTCPMTYPTVYANVFKMGDNWKIVITHEQNGAFSRAVSIYGLDLWENWWFEQKIRGYGKPIIINNGKLLAVILEDTVTVALYKYDYNYRKYVELKNITSPEIQDLKAFTVGIHSFLAIGGENPVIYEIQGTELIPRTIEHYILKHVEFYLPIPLGYYRNDAALLFQHKLDHSTHSSSVLEALQWNGETFTLLDHSPCKLHAEEMYGFSCILDAEGEKGIKGATVLRTVNDNVNVLTASEEYTPIMFEIKTELVEMPNPAEYELEEIHHMKNSLEERFIYQHRILEEAEKISYSNLNEDIFTADFWKIKEIQAPSIHFDGGTQDSIYVAGQDWRQLDLNMDTSQLFGQIKENHNRLKNIMNKLKNAVMKGDGLPETVQKMKITGNLKTKGDIIIKNAKIKNLNGLNVNNVLSNAVKKSKGNKLTIRGDITVKNLNALNVTANYINGINVIHPEPVPYVINGDLKLRDVNHIHILKDVELNGTVNGIDLKNDLYTPDKHNDGALYFDSVAIEDVLIAENSVNGYNFTEEGFSQLFQMKQIDDGKSIMKRDALVLKTLSVDGGLTFDDVNGRSWNKFKDSLVMLDGDAAIKDLKIDGIITLNNNINMKNLNGLSFPDDYVLLNQNSSLFISATKTFANDLQAVEVDCEETVNGIAPQDIVTLSTRQNLNNFSFFDLTVTERMNVQGDITGRELDAFLSNPHLTEVKEVKSNVIFRNLRVNGTVNVQNKVNGSKWSDLFAGVIMKTDQDLTIDSFKTFDGNVFIENGMRIKSGFINNRRISELFTTDTDQVIKNNILSGNISIENIAVHGTFDGVNITELNMNSVKLNNDQSVASNMIFDEDLETTNLEVTNTLNNWLLPNHLLFNDDEVIQLNSPEIDNLYVENLIINGDLESGHYTISGVDLDAFDIIRLSKSEDKQINIPFTVKYGSVNSLDFTKLNGLTVEDIAAIDYKMKNLEVEIMTGNINLGKLYISGILNTSKINEIDLKKLSENAIWLKESNDIETDLIFSDEIAVKDLHLKGNAFNVHFDTFVSDLVNPNDDFVVLKGYKTYVNGLQIIGNMTTEYLNDIKVTNILTTNEDQVLEGDVYVSGNIEVNQNLHTEKTINGVDMNTIAKSFEYVGNNKYNLKGDFILSNEDIHINNLIVYGLINDKYDVEDILESSASVVKDNYFHNTVVFLKPVKLKGNLAVLGTYNGIDIDHLLDDLVMMDADAFINSSVAFGEPLTVEGNLFVDDELKYNYIQECSVEEWKNNAVYLNKKQRISGVKYFKNLTINGNVIVKNLNGIEFNQFVTLSANQDVLGSLKFNKMYVDDAVQVGGLINNVNLDEEYQNTLMINSDQTIETLIHFHSNVTVSGNANIMKANNKDFRNAVTLDSEQDLYSKYNFIGKNVFNNDLNVAGDISNIDFGLWIKNALFTNGLGNNIIEGKLNVSGDITFGDNITGSGTINRLNTDDINKYLSMRDSIKQSNEDNFRTQYKNLCNYVKYLSDVVNTKIYKFNYFEERQMISSVDFLNAYHFVYNTSNYIVMGDKWNCKGYLWKWKGFQFTKINRIEMGCPKKWYTIRNKGSVYLLSISDDKCECKISGTNLWSFDGITLQSIKTLAPFESIFVPSTEDGSYFSIKLNTIYKNNIQGKTENVEETAVSSIPEDNFKFLPGKLTENIILSNGNKLFSMSKEIEMKDDTIASADEVLHLYVGKKNKHLVAVANNTRNTITIFEDPFAELIFQTILCKNPSSMATMDLGNLQTLLVFIEDRKSIQVYSYHGFEGFRRLYQLDIAADAVEFITINSDKNYLLIASDSNLSVNEIIMHGQRIITPRSDICDILY